MPDEPRGWLLLVLLGLGIAGPLLIGLNWLLATARTEKRLIEASFVVRLWRSYRWIWMKIPLNLFGWPHVIDAALRTGRVSIEQTPYEIVWRQGSATLRRYGQGAAAGDAVLVVHSLVSRPSILDLAPGRSLVGFLVDEGFDVFLLDWGDPDEAGATHGLGACAETLIQAEKEVFARASSTRLHLIGYCLGGLLCLIRAGAHLHDDLASIVVLATPVDFSIKVALQPLISHRLFKPAFFLDGAGCVPAQAMRESFHILRPQALRAVIGGWRRRKDETFRHVYDPLARWVWEHRPLAGQAFFDLVELFRTNALLEEGLAISGERVRLQNVRAPVLSLIAERDHIVPSASSRALSGVAELPVTEVVVESGHVSMISGASAMTTTWPTIARWLRKAGQDLEHGAELDD